MTRAGTGYDLHRLAEGRKLMLGGVEVPFDKGPVGHSDGDALAHAICDALLGAAGLGDIGTHFPDSDPKWKNLDPQFPKSLFWLRSCDFVGFRILRPLAIPTNEELRQYWNSGVERE